MDSVSIDKYLVTYDFTDVSKDALQYALKLAKTAGGGEILLGHIIKNKGDNTLAEQKLADVVNSLSAEDQAMCSYKVMEGDIFHDIDKMAKLTDASVIVMGTHGASGLQKVFGSNALKVVSSSSVPFIVVQQDIKDSEINDIVMPFSFQRESVQVTQFAASLAEKFDATVHLVGYRGNDEWLLRDMKVNEKIVHDHLTEHGIKHDTHILPGNKSFEEELLEYAASIDADVIAASYFVKGWLSYYHSFLDTMMVNKHKIPILTINAPEVMTLNSRFTFITG